MRKLFTLIFLFLFLLSVLFSCKKTDVVQDKTALTVDRFFSVDPNAPKEIKAIAKALLKQNDQYNYLTLQSKRLFGCAGRIEI
jgi:hypothetical protein